MAVLILLSAPTGTSIIAPDLRPYLHRLLTDRLAWLIVVFSSFLRYPSASLRRIDSGTRPINGRRRSHLVLAYPHPAHIRFLLAAFTDRCLLLVGLLDAAMAEEAYDIPVDVAIHPAEQLEGSTL